MLNEFALEVYFQKAYKKIPFLQMNVPVSSKSPFTNLNFTTRTDQCLPSYFRIVSKTRAGQTGLLVWHPSLRPVDLDPPAPIDGDSLGRVRSRIHLAKAMPEATSDL